MDNKTKIWIAVGVVIVLLLGMWLAIKSGNKRIQPPGQKAVQKPLQVTKTEVPVAQAPQGFPADIPIEQGAQITQNYNATAANGLFQATRVFVSKQSLDANFTTYSNYLKNNGWTILISSDLPTLKVLSAKKGGAKLQITISQNSITKANSVDISYSVQE